jgi:hypothetical protein
MAFPRGRILRGRGLISLAASAALAFALGACATSTAAAPPHKKLTDNLPDARSLDGRRAALPDGHYTCTIQEAGTRYPDFPCVVASSNGKVRLERVEGPTPVGTLPPAAPGAPVEGDLFCPSENCVEPVATNLLVHDERHYVGEIHTQTGVIHFDLRYRPGGPQAYESAEGFHVAPASAPLAPVRRSTKARPTTAPK